MSCSTATTSCEPRNVLPVHGEIRHMRANAALARATGVPAEHVVIAEDGVVVDLVDGKVEVAGKVDCGYVFVDGSSVGDITEASLKDRRILGEEGFISVDRGGRLGDRQGLRRPGDPRPRLRSRTTRSSTRSSSRSIDALDAAAREGVDDAYQLQQTIRRVIGRWVSQQAPPPADDHPGGRRGLTLLLASYIAASASASSVAEGEVAAGGARRRRSPRAAADAPGACRPRARSPPARRARRAAGRPPRRCRGPAPRTRRRRAARRCRRRGPPAAIAAADAAQHCVADRRGRAGR